MLKTANKQKLIREFETMRLIEQDAHDFYVRAAQDLTASDQQIRNCFHRIAQDENHHVELVDQIINIIRNCL
jgi:rubrerythrin